MYSATHDARVGCTLPFSSMALLWSCTGAPFHSHCRRKRVRLFENIGSWSFASRQLVPPSSDTSTRRILPAPDHARPAISYRPGPCIFMPPDGRVITDFTPISKVNWRALPSGIGSEYLEVSSLVCVGPSVSFRRCSHFTLMLP